MAKKKTIKGTPFELEGVPSGGKSKKKEVSEISPILRALVSDPEMVKGMYIGRDIDERLIGIPSPGLAFSFCIDADLIPVGRMIGIAGPSQSQKTSLALEIARAGLEKGGYTYMVDNEAAKYSPTLLRGILRVPPESNKITVARSDSLEESQERMTGFVRAFYESRNMTELWTLILDSLSGTETADEMKKIDKEGSAGRSHPLIALSWTRYLRWLTSRINIFPIIFISINHLKEKPPPPGQMFAQKGTPGGAAQRFHALFYLWVKRLHISGDSASRKTWDFPSIVDGKIEVETRHMPIEIRRIEITCDKNSQGVDGRSIAVDFCFYVGLDGEKRAFFDWDGSTAALLLDLQEQPGLIEGAEGKNSYGRLRELLPVTCSRGEYTCRELGLVGVSAQVLGFAVHSAPDLMRKLIKFFGIKEGVKWSGRMPDPPTPKLLEYVPPLTES